MLHISVQLCTYPGQCACSRKTWEDPNSVHIQLILRLCVKRKWRLRWSWKLWMSVEGMPQEHIQSPLAKTGRLTNLRHLRKIFVQLLADSQTEISVATHDKVTLQNQVRNVTKQTIATTLVREKHLSSNTATFYYLKCPVFNTNCEICKETVNYGSYTGKRQSIETS